MELFLQLSTTFSEVGAHYRTSSMLATSGKWSTGAGLPANGKLLVNCLHEP